jgi:hypothetical protein
MRVQAQQQLKNATRRELTDAVQDVVDRVVPPTEDETVDYFYEIVVVCTPQPRQSPLAEAAGIPLIPRG